MRDVVTFRNWCKAFVRPASVLEGIPLSRTTHKQLQQAMATIHTEYRRWAADHPNLAQMEWSQLPEEVRLDNLTPGSPGWVRCQSVYVLRQQYVVAASQHTNRRMTLDNQNNVFVLCPFIDSAVIVETFNRYRRSQRHSLVNRVNTDTQQQQRQQQPNPPNSANNTEPNRAATANATTATTSRRAFERGAGITQHVQAAAKNAEAAAPQATTPRWRRACHP